MSEKWKGEMRLSKLMAEQGICSRREADRYIEQGEVLVDGAVVATLGTKVEPSVQITLKDSAKRSQKQLITVALHKPIGYLSSAADKDYPLAHELVTPDRCAHQISSKLDPKTLHVAGRLDIDSTGLLILTQDGRVARALIGDQPVEKEYHINVKGEITQAAIERLCFGLELDGKPLKEAFVECMGPQRLRFVLREGKKRQIRRMCEAVGLRVTRLMRVRIGALQLKGLGYGQWRKLNADELRALSTSTQSRK